MAANTTGAASAALSSTYLADVQAAAGYLQVGEDANWKLAELTSKVCGPSGPRGRDKTYTTLEQWSIDVQAASGREHFGAISAGYYRKVWEKFGTYSGKDQISWTDAYNQMRGVENMDANMASTNLKRGLAHATTEQKQEVFKELAREPIVVDRALRQPDTSAAINAVQLAHHAERQAELDRIEANRDRRHAENMLAGPGRTNRQFVTSAAERVLKVTGDITTLAAILEEEVISYLRPEDVFALRMQLEHLRKRVDRCLELLPNPATRSTG